jgi:hypothetical protein
MRYPPPSIPRRSNKAPIIGFFVIILMAAGLFVFLSGNAVLDTFNKGAFTGSATVLGEETRNHKCYLTIRREDGVKESRATGHRNECGKYDIGQKVHYTQGIIDD